MQTLKNKAFCVSVCWDALVMPFALERGRFHDLMMVFSKKEFLIKF
ncbi:hypothetical protein HPSA_01610 [Helicobacter pylori SouthAfrica7]|uniref:Uncharacterized protein n=1 Tax=Helicobacter pylori (strain SouthAfrica7) TaxID=907239 RepID=E8QV57_HELPW|nr:hypothetical protein HPSA_01610 [Helicobacter pylori SouthAfrica7]